MQAEQVLVDQCRAGDRDAFSQIVSRYQTLICSIAYGVTGNLHASEELAQEAFVTAWRSIDKLREPDRLRSWLCGIVRHLANNQVRLDRRDVLVQAGEIDDAALNAQGGRDPSEASMIREETELVDRALTSIPVTYREPLVLYYRQQESVASVAELLELSQDTVRQRLARGREMLRSEIAAVVERGLLRSAPGRAFTAGVLCALPVMSGTAKAASITATTVKGVSAMNAAGWTGTMGMILGPIAGILGGWFGYSMSLRSARSDRERRFMRQMTLGLLIGIGVFGIALTLLLLQGRNLAARNPYFLVGGIVVLTLGYTIGLFAAIIYSNRKISRIRAEDGTLDMSLSEVQASVPTAIQQFEYPRVYQSRAKLFGLPLVSVRFNGAMGIGDSKGRRAAVGWIAIGDSACGILFACGNIAVGGMAVGAVSLGLISFGGLAIGMLALGGAGLGLWAIGGAAIGWLSFGGIAIAWKAALGGCAAAHDFAVGGLAIGEHVNDGVAKAFVAEEPFFRLAGLAMTPWSWWALVAIALIPMWIAMRLVRPTSEPTSSSI